MSDLNNYLETLLVKFPKAKQSYKTKMDDIRRQREMAAQNFENIK
jgi:hypothetical protein